MSWLDDASANRIVQSYINKFLDLSGNLKVRNAVEVPNDMGAVNWTQLGSDIDGEALYDNSGYSVSLSSDGTILAIGAYKNDGNGSNSGHVRVYQYANSTWSQLGSDIDGEAAGNLAGYSISLSDDGMTLAVGEIVGGGGSKGQVRVYRYSGGSWSQLGNDIVGEANDDFSGGSVSLSSNGSRVAIGATGNDGNGDRSGHVRVYYLNGSSWSRLGQDIDGEAAGDFSGYPVSLSSNGSIVAISAQRNDGNGSNAGHVRVYQYANSTWSQLGSDIDGEAASDFSGSSVSLSSDGTIVAIGAKYNDDPVNAAGHVRVYEYSGGSWNQRGGDIDGEAADDRSGYSVSLSSDGSIVAIGAINNDGKGSNSGHVRVYQYVNSTWTQIGSDIDGEAVGDESGFSVSLSSDGSKVAIGAWKNDGNGNNSGHVRVYDGGFDGGNSIISVPVLDVSGGTVNMLSSTMDVSSGIVDISGTTWMNRGQSGGTIVDAYQKGLVIESNKTSADDAVLHIETAGQTQAFSVRADGAVYADNVLEHSSDDRRKFNEQHITNASEIINKLSPQIYTKLNAFVENGGTPTKTESGLIAQEIYYNAPELRHLVYTEGNPQPYDLSGTTIENDPDYSALGWGHKSATVNYIGLIPYLIKANQEKQAILDEQEAVIAQQTTQVEELKTRLSSLKSK